MILPISLKCTWNLFLKHDVQMKPEYLGNHLPVIAMLEHLLKLYELDKPRQFRWLHKLTDICLNPTSQSTMKANLAAQAMSHTVAAIFSDFGTTDKDHCTVHYELYYYEKSD
jgi:hypothetical protein